jgi:hypothetical protein
MRKRHRRELLRIARRRQRDVLCDVMLSAQQRETWLTLDELAKLTHYPPASISAQLRHLRKPEFGRYEVEKRQRATGRTGRRAWCCSGCTTWDSHPTEQGGTFLAGASRAVNWTEQIRHRCGKELLGRGMFPPRNYFSSAA